MRHAFARRLEAALCGHDLGAVCASTGIAHRRLSRLADGTTRRVDVVELERLADALGVGVLWLVTGEGEGPAWPLEPARARAAVLDTVRAYRGIGHHLLGIRAGLYARPLSAAVRRLRAEGAIARRSGGWRVA